MPTSIATSLTVNRRSFLTFSRTRAIVSSVRYAESCPGHWSSSI